MTSFPQGAGNQKGKGGISDGGGFLARFNAVDNGVCVTKTKRAGRKLLVPLYPNNVELSFDTGPECNILDRIERDTIVLALSPRGPDPLPLKVAGLPGDVVTLGAGNVLMINGAVYKSSAGRDYNLNRMTQRNEIDKIKKQNDGKIPEGFYFLMGDNDAGFLDSSNFGLIGADKIQGILQQPE